MLKIKIFSPGKDNRGDLSIAIAEYTKRLQKEVEIEWIFPKNSMQLEQMLQKIPNYICLHPVGKLFTSEKFSTWFHEKSVECGNRLTFVIGGAEGLSEGVLSKSVDQISLSPLTFTHIMTRLILIEQIYRALEIKRGGAYHK